MSGTCGVITHDWVEAHGGAERVLASLVRILPGAEVRTLWKDPGVEMLRLRESWLARTPLRGHKLLAMPFMLGLWRAWTTDEPWVLASTHLFAHHMRTRDARRTVKLAYVHTPARYIWEPQIDQRGRGLMARVFSPSLRAIDRRRAQELRAVAANSEYVAERIRRAWRLEPVVIYPPVDVPGIMASSDAELSVEELRTLDRLPSDFILGASRFVAYKRLDAAIRCGEVAGADVVIAGSGPLESELRARAAKSGVTCHIIVAPSDALLRALYRRARCFVFIAVEDFGIMPVEAMASGLPVIVSRQGGAKESVLKVGGGAVLSDESDSGWLEALHRVSVIDRHGLPGRTTVFGPERFEREMLTWMRSAGAPV